jgi:NAD(P)-dependent dehydrogenase (short-subunit alcohol dehydrogenase family)
MGLLDGKVVIVTGAGRGLGRSHSLELARRGAVVVVNDDGSSVRGEPSDEAVAEDVARQIHAAGGMATPDTTSVVSYHEVAALVDRAIKAFGRVDGVVNNAGIVREGNLVTMSEKDFDAVVDVHLKGTFNLSKHVAEHFHRRWQEGDRSGGRIVNTTSGSGLRGSPSLAYAAAKAAVAALTVSAAMQLRDHGVTVNAIAPVARTRMNPGHYGATPPPGAEGTDPLAPENASALVAYLLSDAAAWLTGQVIRVDGNVVRRYHPWKVGRQAYEGLNAPLQAEELDDALRLLYGVLPIPYFDPRNLKEVAVPGTQDF